MIEDRQKKNQDFKNDETVRIQAKELIDFCIKILVKIDVSMDDAKIIADSLIDADLRGVYSHGIMRLPIYIHHMLKEGPGGIARRPNITTIKDASATALVDGDNALGHLASYKAMKLAIKKSEEYGVSAVGVYNSNHNGAEAYFTMMALEHDMIGVCVTVGGTKIIAPWGGLTPLLGNNPFSFAIPAGEELPVVLDMACSVVARGWILMAKKNNWKIPEGWAVDKDGNPTQEPHEAYDGLVLPVGGYKGYALTLIGCILGGVLTGASIGSEITDLYGDFNKNQNLGHFFGAISIKKYLPVETFKSRMDRLIIELKSSRLIDGVEKIYLPGEKEFEVKKENMRKGVPISEAVFKELNALGSFKLKT